jgi:hypothetical protein
MFDESSAKETSPSLLLTIKTKDEINSIKYGDLDPTNIQDICETGHKHNLTTLLITDKWKYCNSKYEFILDRPICVSCYEQDM